MAHLGIAGGDRIEALEGWHQLAGGEDFDLERAVAHGGNALGQVFGTRAKAWKILRPGGDHFQLFYALGDGGGRKAASCCGGACDQTAGGGCCDKVTAFHGLSLSLLRCFFGQDYPVYFLRSYAGSMPRAKGSLSLSCTIE